VVEAVAKLCVAGEVGECVPASRLLGSAGKSMAPHEYYEAEAYARRLLEEN
jgi:hypothetical protein